MRLPASGRNRGSQQVGDRAGDVRQDSAIVWWDAELGEGSTGVAHQLTYRTRSIHRLGVALARSVWRRCRRLRQYSTAQGGQSLRHVGQVGNVSYNPGKTYATWY